MISSRRKLLLFTSQDIGFQFVSYLATRADIELLVVCDRTSRDDQYGYRSAIDACEQAGIPYVKTSRPSGPVVDRIRAFAPDLMMTVYYPHIVPRAVQEMSRIPAVNIHPGLLPHYRGRYPMPWYILNGEKEFGMAIHRLDEGIDTGDVLVQTRHPIGDHETGHEIYRRGMDAGAQLLIGNLDALLQDALPARAQTGTGSYFSTIERRFEIDWNSSRETIARRVRVHAKPYFPAFSFLFNRLISINRASPVEIDGYKAQGGGRIVRVDPDGCFVVACADGCLRIDEHEACPAWSADDFRRTVRAGAQFER